MCAVSMIYDHYWEKWNHPQPPTYSPGQPVAPVVVPLYPVPSITPAEIEEFKKLLERAREYDRKHNQPDCELEEKRKRIRDLAKNLGVEIDFV